MGSIRNEKGGEEELAEGKVGSKTSPAATGFLPLR